MGGIVHQLFDFSQDGFQLNCGQWFNHSQRCTDVTVLAAYATSLRGQVDEYPIILSRNFHLRSNEWITGLGLGALTSQGVGVRPAARQKIVASFLAGGDKDQV